MITVISHLHYLAGAFIIPFFVMLIVVGMPLLLLELGLGQKLRVGAAGAWKLVRYNYI